MNIISKLNLITYLLTTFYTSWYRKVSSPVVWDINFTGRKAHIGYWIYEKLRRKGIATESVKLLCEYADSKMGMHRLYTEVFTNNAGSVKVLLNSGFQIEGVARNDFLYNGEYRDSFHFARIFSGKGIWWIKCLENRICIRSPVLFFLLPYKWRKPVLNGNDVAPAIRESRKFNAVCDELPDTSATDWKELPKQQSVTILKFY